MAPRRPPKRKYKRKKKTVSTKPVRDEKIYYFQPFNFNLIISQAPKVFRSAFYPQFHSLFATDRHIYVLHSYCEDTTLRFARLCKIAQTWELLGVSIPRTSEVNFCILHWDQRTALLFTYNDLIGVDLESLHYWHIETTSLALTLEEADMVVNVERDIKAEFICHALDKMNNCIYVQCRLKIGWDIGEYGIYKLDWRTKMWSKMELVPNDTQLPAGKYMALWEGQLFMGMEEFQTHQNVYYRNKYVYNRVVCVNLSTLEWAIHTTQPFLHRRRTIRFPARSKVKWAQIGPNMYCISSLESSSHPAKNDFWSFHLPTLTWTRHKEATELKEQMKSFVICSSENEIWALKKECYYTSQYIYAYQISLELPKLHTLARNAFLYRKPHRLVYPKRVITRSKETKSLSKQALTVKRIKQYLQGESLNAEIFKLPDN